MIQKKALILVRVPAGVQRVERRMGVTGLRERSGPFLTAPES
jgi:hypothetical protein